MNVKRILWIIPIIVIVLVVILLSQGKGPVESGLIDTREIELTPEMRDLVEQRVAVTRSAIDAQEAVGDVDWDLYTVLAYDYELLGELRLAAETYETYLELSPVTYVAWAQYAEVMRLRGDLETAESAYRQALSMFVSQQYVLSLVQIIEDQAPNGERKDEVRALLDLAVRAEGQNTTYMVYLALWELAYGSCANAYDFYENAIRLTENEDLVATIRGDLEDARRTCEAR